MSQTLDPTAAAPAPALRAPATQWSLVFSSPVGTVPAQQALAELCLRYSYPVYGYLRRCGHAPEAAADALQAYFRQLAALPGGSQMDAAGRFRLFLIEQLHRHFVQASPAGTFVALAALAPEALESRYQKETEPATSPEAGFHRAFAREVLYRASQRLEHEAAQAGRQTLYQHLAPFLAREPAPGQYEALAMALDSRPLALVTAVKRLRQRFRELVDSELAETVATAEDLALERQALRTLLQG